MFHKTMQAAAIQAAESFVFRLSSFGHIINMGKQLMKNRLPAVIWVALLLVSILASCASREPLPPNGALLLASLSENSVDVSISLLRDAQGNVFLAAEYTPPPGYHLYSKDLPREGMEGLGRPTLLELTANSKMTALGPLVESVAALEEISDVAALTVYPAGPVTLTLAVSLPPGAGWVDDELSLTFMACTATGCKPPVVGQIVAVRVPGADSLSNP
ncbi:MAG: hypothetical protein AB1750_04880 [Chloroflexota bacterium]